MKKIKKINNQYIYKLDTGEELSFSKYSQWFPMLNIAIGIYDEDGDGKEIEIDEKTIIKLLFNYLINKGIVKIKKEDKYV